MIRIKKYGNRRLYNTATSSYVNLEELAGLIRAGHAIEVVDVQTEEDLTRQVLLQVLLEQQGALGALPPSLLHRIIRAADPANPLQKLWMTQLGMGLDLLDAQLQAFDRQFGTSPKPPPAAAPAPPPPAPEAAPPQEPEPAEELDALRSRLADLEKRLSKR